MSCGGPAEGCMPGPEGPMRGARPEGSLFGLWAPRTAPFTPRPPNSFCAGLRSASTGSQLSARAPIFDDTAVLAQGCKHLIVFPLLLEESRTTEEAGLAPGRWGSLGLRGDTGAWVLCWEEKARIKEGASDAGNVSERIVSKRCRNFLTF